MLSVAFLMERTSGQPIDDDLIRFSCIFCYSLVEAMHTMTKILTAFIVLAFSVPVYADMHLFFLAKAKGSNEAPELAFVNMKSYRASQCEAAIENIAGNAQEQNIDFVDARCMNTFYKFSQPTEDIRYVYLLKYLGGAPTLFLMDSVEDCYREMTNSDDGDVFCGRASQRIVYP
jgi:hypothetical protein